MRSDAESLDPAIPARLRGGRPRWFAELKETRGPQPLLHLLLQGEVDGEAGGRGSLLLQ